MPFLGAVPIAVAAVVIAKLWQRRGNAPMAELEAQNQEMREELKTLRRELTEAQEPGLRRAGAYAA